MDPDPHESALIWLSWFRMENADPDPEAWNLTKINKKPGFLHLKKTFAPLYKRIHGYVFDLLPTF